MRNNRSHSKGATDLAQTLYWFLALFNIAFFKQQPVQEPVIVFENNRVKSLGHHPVKGRNKNQGDAAIYRVNPNMNLPGILSSILHLMVHTWQEQYGTPGRSWFHNHQFRKKIGKIGIRCDPAGHHLGLGDPFVFILKKHGVDFVDQSSTGDAGAPELHTGSKLIKWSCRCTNVRVAVNFKAVCLKCGQVFKTAT